MKQFALIILFTLCVSQTAKAQVNNFLLKSVTTSHDNESTSSRMDYAYNENGRVKEVNNYSLKGNEWEKTSAYEFTYSKNKMRRTVVSAKNNQLLEEMQKEYNGSGLMKEESQTTYWGDGNVQSMVRSVYKYDKKRLVEKKQYGQNGNLTMKESYRYDANGNATDIETDYLEGKESKKHVSILRIFNADNQLLQQTMVETTSQNSVNTSCIYFDYNPDGTVSTRYNTDNREGAVPNKIVYHYDKQRNIIRKDYHTPKDIKKLRQDDPRNMEWVNDSEDSWVYTYNQDMVRGKKSGKVVYEVETLLRDSENDYYGIASSEYKQTSDGYVFIKKNYEYSNKGL